MSYITMKIKNGRFKNPLAKYKYKNLNRYIGYLEVRRSQSTRYVENYEDYIIQTPWVFECELSKDQENCTFDIADIKVDDFIRFTLFDKKYNPLGGKLKDSNVEYVRVYSITDKEICFDIYINRISWESHQDSQYY